MTRIKVDQYVAGRYSLTEDSINDMMGSASIAHSNSSARFQLAGATQLLVEGSGLKFASNGDLIGGSITRLTYFEGSAKAFVATGLAINAAKARIAYNQHEDYPVAPSPVFTFTAHLTAPGADNAGVDFFGWTGNDKLLGSAFDDILSGLPGKDTIKGLGGDDLLDGGNGKDKLYGGAGNDTLFGGEGNDTVDGGSGRDWYMGPSSSSMGSTKALNVDLAKGKATGFGTDKLVNIESVYGNRGNDTLKGNGVANTFNGSDGNDSISGGGGNDKLYGASGFDTLKGGAGRDSFVFLAPYDDVDHIKDFKPGTDKILLGKTLYASLAEGTVAGVNFVSGKNAKDGNDFIVYDKSSGKLYYDADGSGGGAKKLIAILDNKPALHASDIVVHDVVNDPGFWI